MKATVARAANPNAVLAVLPDELVADAKMACTLLGTPQEVKDECDRINAAMHEFWKQEPDWVMRALNALSTRLTELYRLLYRAEVSMREYTRIRTMDVQPLLDEVDRQFKNQSRLLEARRQDLALDGIGR
jgi:hypothetical protein